MSREATAWAWEHCRAPREEKLLLLAIANDVDHDGLDGHPSQRRLAHLLACSQATIRRGIERLEGAGELLVLRPAKVGRGHFSRYAVVMGRDPAKLAGQIGWPAPRLDEAVAAEWEQLVLDHTRQVAQRAADGYEFVNSVRGVAPYPLDEEDGDNLGESSGDSPAERTEKNGKGRHIADSDPQTLTTTSTSRPYPSTLQRPTTEQADAVIAADKAQARAATLTPEEVHAIVAQAKGQITEVRSEGDDAGPASPQDLQPPGLEADDGSRAPQEAVEPVEDDLGGRPDVLAVEDRWAERADLR